MRWTEKLRLLTAHYGDTDRLVRASKIGYDSILRWKRGKFLPRNEAEVIKKLAAALEVDEAWFADPAQPWPPRPRNAQATASVARRAFGPQYEAIYHALADPDLLPQMLAYAQGLLASRSSRTKRPK